VELGGACRAGNGAAEWAVGVGTFVFFRSFPGPGDSTFYVMAAVAFGAPLIALGDGTYALERIHVSRGKLGGTLAAVVGILLAVMWLALSISCAFANFRT
jgi:hypothetical protein